MGRRSCPGRATGCRGCWIAISECPDNRPTEGNKDNEGLTTQITIFVFFVTFCKGFLQIIYEAAWRRTYRSFFAADSFFPHGFCSPICPRRVYGSREWPALVAYAVAGRDLHGPGADGRDAL